MVDHVKDWALIIHAESSGNRVDVYWVDIEAGRIGLRLANEVRQWRRRDDLLTIGKRVVVSIAPPIEAPDPSPNAPPEAPRTPVEASRAASRHEYLAGRVRAVVAHSQLAAKHLQLEWPKGIPGLKQGGHSWEQLDAIYDAVLLVEKEHSVPFYPEWDDPAVEQSKREHPSAVWAVPKEAPSTQEDRDAISTHILNHPRSGLAREWIMAGVRGGIDSSIDTAALAHALTEFLNLDAAEWNDDDLTAMLDGSLRALGYANGINDLGRFNPDHAPLLMSAAFAIAAGNAMLLFDENENPIVRTNVRKG